MPDEELPSDCRRFVELVARGANLSTDLDRHVPSCANCLLHFATVSRTREWRLSFISCIGQLDCLGAIAQTIGGHESFNAKENADKAVAHRASCKSCQWFHESAEHAPFIRRERQGFRHVAMLLVEARSSHDACQRLIKEVSGNGGSFDNDADNKAWEEVERHVSVCSPCAVYAVLRDLPLNDLLGVS